LSRLKKPFIWRQKTAVSVPVGFGKNRSFNFGFKNATALDISVTAWLTFSYGKTDNNGFGRPLFNFCIFYNLVPLWLLLLLMSTFL